MPATTRQLNARRKSVTTIRKVTRAMELIAEREPTARGPYAGAVGYLTFAGDLDFCITIRTAVVTDGRAHIQAGAGVVADSDPDAELAETKAKAAALLPAIGGDP